MNSNIGNSAGTDTARAESPRTQGDGEFRHTPAAASDSFTELKYRSTANYSTATMAKGIGIFSIALGLAEVLMPNQIGELAGISRSHRSMLPALGAREIAHGLGIMRSAKPTTAVWTRVGGDVL